MDIGSGYSDFIIYRGADCNIVNFTSRHSMPAAKNTATKRVRGACSYDHNPQKRGSFQRGFATSGARIKEEGRKAGMFEGDRLIYAIRFRGSVMSEETMESVKK